MKETVKTMGRPQKTIEKDKFEKYVYIGLNIFEIATLFNCSPSSIRRYVKQTYVSTFEQFAENISGSLLTGMAKCVILKALEDNNLKAAMFTLETRAGWIKTQITQAQEPLSISIIQKAHNIVERSEINQNNP